MKNRFEGIGVDWLSRTSSHHRIIGFKFVLSPILVHILNAARYFTFFPAQLDITL